MPDWLLVLAIMLIAGTASGVSYLLGKRASDKVWYAITRPDRVPKRLELLAQSHCVLKLLQTDEIFVLSRNETLELDGFEFISAKHVVDDMADELDITNNTGV